MIKMSKNRKKFIDIKKFTIEIVGARLMTEIKLIWVKKNRVKIRPLY